MRTLIVVPIAALAVSGLLWCLSRGQWSLDAEEPAAALATPVNGPQPSAASATPLREDGPDVPDVVRIPACTLTPIQEQNISSQLDGQLHEVDVALGQVVTRGQRLARLDDRKLLPQIELLELRANSDTDERIARAQFKEADAKVKYAEAANLRDPKAVPELEVKTYLAQRERFEQEMKKAREEQMAAKKELDKARVLVELHQVKTDLDGEVVKVFKHAGEAVKQAETLFSIARTDRLRIDGFCKVQHAHRLRPGQRVLVEPELQGPQRAELIGHTNTITDLAVSADGKLLASASLDGTVLLWAWPGGRRLGVLTHPAAVLAVDIVQTTPGEYRLVTGAEDGKLRVWALTGGKAHGPLHELTGHDGPIRSVRIHPDGVRCATGGEDHRIGWWDVADGKHLRWCHVPGAWKQAAHQGAVTDLRFGSGSTLVSAGSDNTLKVWTLAPADNALVKAHRGRTGDVTKLGLSPDGTAALFDHGDELRLLRPETGAAAGVVQNWKHVRFQAFAGFSPSGRLLLSASADGRLQIWKTPAPRGDGADGLKQLGGFEVRHYALPKASEVRCGVFAPDEAVFFTGGTDRSVRAWSVPGQAEWQPREATLTYVGSEVEQGTDLVRVQAEMDNAGGAAPRLRAGTFVTLKAYPDPPN